MNIPSQYDLPTHLSKLFRSDPYKAAAAKVGKTAEAFQDDVTKELKKVVAEYRDADIAAFEAEVGKRALAAAAKHD